MSYLPLYDNILVRLVREQEKTQSGIILPGAGKEKPQKGQVVAIGQGRALDNGTIRPMAVRVGQTVIFKSYAPTELPGEEDLVMLSEADIIAIIE